MVSLHSARAPTMTQNGGTIKKVISTKLVGYCYVMRAGFRIFVADLFRAGIQNSDELISEHLKPHLALLPEVDNVKNPNERKIRFKED